MYFGNNTVSIYCPSIDSPISFLSGKSFMVPKSLVWLDSYYSIDMGGTIMVSWNNKFLLCILPSVSDLSWYATFIDQALTVLLLILNLGLEIQ